MLLLLAGLPNGAVFVDGWARWAKLPVSNFAFPEGVAKGVRDCQTPGGAAHRALPTITIESTVPVRTRLIFEAVRGPASSKRAVQYFPLSCELGKFTFSDTKS